MTRQDIFNFNRGDIRVMRGSYLLGVYLERDMEIEVGALGRIGFYPGFYLYCGSAMGGICGRISRYLSEIENKFWHIDYLVSEGDLSFIDVFISDLRLECVIANILSEMMGAINSFGSSDCECMSHLFFLGGNNLDEVRCQLCLRVMSGSGVSNIFSLYY